MRPPIVERGPWKPAAAAVPVPIPARGLQETIGDAVETMLDAYAKVAFFDILLILVRILGYGVYLAVRVAFHLLR